MPSLSEYRIVNGLKNLYNSRTSLYNLYNYYRPSILKRNTNNLQKPLEEQENAPIKISVPEKARQFNTHKYIIKCAMDVILSDMYKSNLSEINSPLKTTAVKDFFTENIRKIYQGSIDPDISENDLFMGIPTFEGHFYDPDTGNNFRGNSTPSAYTRFVEHSLRAKKLFEKKDPSFSLELGRALHYLCDAGEPHHSSNKIVLLSNHLPYEKYAKLIKESAKIKSGNFYHSFQPINLQLDSNFKEYSKKILIYTAHFSKSYSHVDNIKFNYTDTNSQTNQSIREITLNNIDSNQLNILNKSIIENIENCQQVTSGFIFNFLKATKII